MILSAVKFIVSCGVFNLYLLYMSKRRTRRRRTRKRGSGKKAEAEKIWKEFLARRKDAKYREFMKKNPLKKMSVKDAFKQSNMPSSKTTYNVPITDAKIKELEKNLMKKSGNYTEGKTVTQYPKKAGRRRTRRRKKKKKTRKRKKR